MTKFLLAGVTAFVLMTGVAFAQSSSSDTTTSTTTTAVPIAPAVGNNYSTSKTQKSIDSNGTEVDKNQTYTTGVNGSSTSSNTQTTAPDGSKVSTSHEERTATPRGDTTSSSRTTTTTTGQ